MNKNPKAKLQRRDILIKSQQEYTASQKPFKYEYKSPAGTTAQKKFGILISQLKDIIEIGMKEEMLRQDEQTIGYWDLLHQKFKGTTEMDFVADEMYGKNKMKVKHFLVILMATGSIFQKLKEIHNMSEMYEDRDEQEYNQQLDHLSFLRDGQYEICGEIIGEFRKFEIERREQEELQRRQEEAQRQQKLMQEQQRKAKELQIEREKEAKRLAMEQSLRLEAERKRIAEEKYKEKPKVTMLEASWLPQQLIDSRKSNAKLPNLVNTPIQQKTTPGQHLKRSQILFQQNFKSQQTQYTFALKPVESVQSNNCYQCKKPLSTGLYIIMNNKNFCHYTGNWFCSECQSDERMPIAWKALQSFDLRGYSVCRKAQIEIKSLFDKPILQINNDSNIVKHNQKLFQFLINKRQLHFMYDTICNVDFIVNLLGNRINYCLKQNIFSLKNLYDIYNSQEELHVKRAVDSLSTHFYQCADCQKKGFKCKSCNNPVKIFTFELRSTKGCAKCKKLYHRQCLRIKGCLCAHK